MAKDGITTKIEGIEKAVANLKKWQIIKRQAIEDILKETGLKIEASTKRDGNVPVDTGRLAASISTNWSGSGMTYGKVTKKAKSEDGVGQPPGPKGLTVVVGSNVSYAHMQEFSSWGSAPREKKEAIYRRSKKHVPRKRPREGFLFLTKAYYKNAPDAAKRIRQVVGKDENIKA